VIVVLDSTVLIDHLRGRPAAERVEWLALSGDVAATTAINVEEIERGLRPGEEAAADALFGGLVILPIGLEEGRRAGAWRREFAVRGITLSQADCLVAAAALEAGARLATGNPADFPMDGLDVEDWPVGR
jgi:predicted nucleic acid-binding protein